MSSAHQTKKAKLLQLWDSLDPLPTGVLAVGETPRKGVAPSLGVAFAKLGEAVGHHIDAHTKKPSERSLEVARRWLDSRASPERLERLAEKFDVLKKADEAERRPRSRKVKAEAQYG